MPPLKPPPPPVLKGESADAYRRRMSAPGVEVHEMVTPPRLPAMHAMLHPEKVVERVTNSAKVFWTAVGLACTIASGGFYAGAKFVQLQTEFRTQMASMVTKDDLRGEMKSLRPACVQDVIAWLKSAGVTVNFPNYQTRGKPYAGRVTEVQATQ